MEILKLLLVPSEYVANMLFKVINLVLRTVLEKCEKKPSPLLMRSYILAVSDHFGLNSVYVCLDLLGVLINSSHLKQA